MDKQSKIAEMLRDLADKVEDREDIEYEAEARMVRLLDGWVPTGERIVRVRIPATDEQVHQLSERAAGAWGRTWGGTK